MYTYIFIVFLSLLGIISANASNISSNETLRVDNIPVQMGELSCDFNDNISIPKRDFEILQYTLMSSDSGNRYALITIRNNSSGQRIFTQDYLVAIFGNCKRHFPNALSKKFSGKETITINVSFGKHLFPIVKISTEE